MFILCDGIPYHEQDSLQMLKLQSMRDIVIKAMCFRKFLKTNLTLLRWRLRMWNISTWCNSTKIDSRHTDESKI